VHSAQHHVENNVITASSFFEALMSQIKNERKVLTWQTLVRCVLIRPYFRLLQHVIQS